VIEHILTFDRSAYSADAIQRAAYVFGDRLSIDLQVKDTIYECVLHLETDEADAAEAIVSEFRKEVLDHVLRERIRNETEEVRNLILAHAFSNTGLVGDG
jgi:His-Xaa-Ser system protein HxsD